MTHLSAILAAFTDSIQTMTRPLWVVVVRVIPRVDPGVLSISTSSGPVAFRTASESTAAMLQIKNNFNENIKIYLVRIIFISILNHSRSFLGLRHSQN